MLEDWEKNDLYNNLIKHNDGRGRGRGRVELELALVL